MIDNILLGALVGYILAPLIVFGALALYVRLRP